MTKIEIFYSPVCPHCPQARKLVAEVASEFNDIEIIEVNTYTEEGIERGMSMQVMAVPCVAIDDEIKLVGWPFTREDLINHFKN